jgi:hypothetical protein
MAEGADLNLSTAANRNAELGAEAARRIWDDEADEGIHDPRTPEFACAMVKTSVSILKTSSGLIKKMIDRAAAAAGDLAVAQFQGLIEAIQNADDVGATEVRFALREGRAGRQLLIVHNGQPITCHNVLPMALPFLTTKTERTDQRGRFGIGLKTLRRIATSIAIHSAPYHFSGDQLRFDWIEAEPGLPGFYDPAADTMLALDLHERFDEVELKNWFEAWQDDGLLFLASVGRFRWCDLNGQTIAERSLVFDPWRDAGISTLHEGALALRVREVRGPQVSWTVWRATLVVPTHLHPAHKARSETTDISLAIADGNARPSLYIGFKTLIPVTLPFSLDAQFDPSPSRETIIEDPWNNWLIDRCAEVVGDIAARLLASDPIRAWALIPLGTEQVGKDNDHWVRGRFNAALETMRGVLAQSAAVTIRSGVVALSDLAYEDEVLGGFLTPSDIKTLAPEAQALSIEVRDSQERWRSVLDLLGVSRVIGTAEFLKGFDDGLFADKAPAWWVDAGARLTAAHPAKDLFDRAFLLADNQRALACQARDKTERPIVFGATLSSFAARWNLLDRLHAAYGDSDTGTAVLAWLTANAAFTSHVDAEADLAAFAEQFAAEPRAIRDEELRELRARFDSVSDRRAEKLGPKVGAALLLEGYTFKGGKQQRLKVSPGRAYLCRTLDGENSHWPDAAKHTPGISWIAAKYDAVLKTEAGRWAKRKREDGSVSRGPRRILTLLGAEIAPRLVRSDRARWGSEARVRELQARGAEQVGYDEVSPDLSRVLKDLQKTSKRDARLRSPALLRTLARHWDRLYADRQTVPAEHVAIKYIHDKGTVTAAWLNELRETSWVAAGRGELVAPDGAVVRTMETESLYGTFVCDIGPGEIDERVAEALRLITDVRVGDLLTHLEGLRDSGEPVDEAHVLRVYRTIAKRCPRVANYSTRIGEISAQNLRLRFLAGNGLIYVGGGQWRRPDQVLRGMDIFHDRNRFVPGGSALSNLWIVLDVHEPDLNDCIQFCRELANSSCDAQAAGALMDVYRYMEHLTGAAERRHKEKLKTLPLACSERWVTTRPVYFVEEAELRKELASAVTLSFWTPPCDTRDFPNLVTMMGIERLAPELIILAKRDEAMERGESWRQRFGHAVDHLSTELARNDPATRDKIVATSAGSWDGLKAVPLFVYEEPIRVHASIPALSSAGVVVSLKARVMQNPLEIHARCEDIGDRECGGRAIASLFPPEVRRRIDAEWALAWQKSRDTAADAIRLASDEKRAEAMEEQAAKINAGLKRKIKVTPPASRNATAKSRTLKDSVGAVVGAAIQPGNPSPQPPEPRSHGGLKSKHRSRRSQAMGGLRRLPWPTRMPIFNSAAGKSWCRRLKPRRMKGWWISERDTASGRMGCSTGTALSR